MNSHRLVHEGSLALAALTLAVLGFQGCGDAPTGTGYGTLAVQFQFDQGFEGNAAGAPGSALAPLDDDPIPAGGTPLSDLIITFDRVEAWSCSGDSMEFEEEDCVVHVVADTTITLSVAGLDTTLTQLLGLSELPAGDYTRLVLRLTDAKVVTQAGDTVQAALPGDSDRLKVNSPFTISEDSVTDVVIVFDVHRSIVETPPGSMSFTLKPVLHSHQGWYEGD
jgi:hypothetical protein